MARSCRKAPAGTPPLAVASTTRVENLNADRLDGLHASAFATVAALVNEIANLQQQLDELNALAGISQKTAFVTSQTFDGDLGGIDGAITKCNEAARSAGLIGFYRPWLATANESPVSTMYKASVPYVRTDGAVVADDWADLTDSVLTNPIDHDEFGTDLSGTNLVLSQVASNVRPDGTALFSANEATCFQWTSNTNVLDVSRGPIGLFVSTEPGFWTASQTVDPPGYDAPQCSGGKRLYCFQQ